MSWTVEYTATAWQDLQDLRNIYEYIAYNLLTPEIAAGQIQRIMHKTGALDEMPMRHSLYAHEPWRSQGLRFLPVDNYIVFYLPRESINTVDIVRIMYGGRNIQKQLNETEIQY